MFSRLITGALMVYHVQGQGLCEDAALQCSLLINAIQYLLQTIAMDFSIHNVLTILTILTTGLSAGLFYAWAVSVIPGTRRISDRSYLESMQSMNRAIQNPAFFIVFIGPVLLLLTSSYLQFREAVDASFWLMLCATLVYLAGTFGITVGGNVPLNNALDSVRINNLGIEELSQARRSFEEPWNRLHRIRTIFSVVSFLLLLAAVL